MAAIWMALALYTNERVLTPQVLANLAMQSGGMTMAPDQVDALQRLEWLSYGLLPVMLAVRVAITALPIAIASRIVVIPAWKSVWRRLTTTKQDWA